MGKILFLSYVSGVPSKNFGGSNHVIYDFIYNVKQNEYEFDFLSASSIINNLTADKLKNAKNSLSRFKKFTYDLYYMNSIYRNIVKRDFYMPYHFFRKNRFIRKHIINDKYDIIHSHDSVGLSFINNKNTAAKIMTIHSVSPLSKELTNQIKNKLIKEKYFKELRKKEKVSYEQADVVTFPSNAVRRAYLRNMEIEKEKDFRIIYNGIDVDKIMRDPFRKPRHMEDFWKNSVDLILLSVASHTKHKRIDIALEAVRELVHVHKLNVRFVNIGVGNLTGYLKNLAKEYQIEESVKFLGQIDNSEVLNWMKTSDVLLHVSERVVFDLVVLEAMACGLCVVASNEGGNKEIITNGINGYLLEQYDASYIAQALLKADRNRVRENAYRTIHKFSIKKKANEYYELYREFSV